MQGPALSGDRRNHDHLVARAEDAAELCPTLLERCAQHPAAVEVQQVEHEVGHGAARAPGQALAERVIVSASLRIHHNKLAVQDG